jgi:hypothetical protein
MPWRYRTLALALGALAISAWGGAQTRQDHPLLRRWVGSNGGRPLVLEFFGDTMLVVNDERVLNFELGPNRVRAYGDSAFTLTYWFVRDRLLVQTEEGTVITMAPQGPLARSLFGGRWRNSSTGQHPIELEMLPGGVARWRSPPEGRWSSGEWDRTARIITFTWLPDSTIWTAQYDPAGAALLFSETTPGSGTVILRHTYRW